MTFNFIFWCNLNILCLCYVDEPAFNETTPSSVDDESSSQGEMTIHLPGAPVTADLQEPEHMDEDNWSESEMFHGFTTDEIDEQVNNAEHNR